MSNDKSSSLTFSRWELIECDESMVSRYRKMIKTSAYGGGLILFGCSLGLRVKRRNLVFALSSFALYGFLMREVIIRSSKVVYGMSLDKDMKSVTIKKGLVYPALEKINICDFYSPSEETKKNVISFGVNLKGDHLELEIVSNSHLETFNVKYTNQELLEDVLSGNQAKVSQYKLISEGKRDEFSQVFV